MKVLILAYDFPPYVSVAGLRPKSWSDYLYKYGFQTVVITRDWVHKYGDYRDFVLSSPSRDVRFEQTEETLIIRTPYKPTIANRILLEHGFERHAFIRKTFTAILEFTQWFLPMGSKRRLFTEAMNYMLNNNVDIILATGEPFILFRYASILSRKFKVPWIADYRDPWNTKSRRNAKRRGSTYESFVEKRVLRTARAAITVSDYFRTLILERNPELNCYLISNGYEKSNFDQFNSTKPDSRKLRIGYGGTIYDWHPWRLFLKCCSELVQKGSIDLEIRFYGTSKEKEISDFVVKEEPTLQEIVLIKNRVPSKKLIAELSSCHVLLLFNDYSIIGTKIYDYLMLGRRIILLFSNDKSSSRLKKQFPFLEHEKIREQEDLIARTKSGTIVRDVSHLTEVLLDLDDELRNNKKISSSFNDYDEYSRENQVKKLASIIKGLV